MDRLNIFNQFKDKENNHEDVLTRNFMLLVKNIPAVQVAFLEKIRATIPGANIESAACGDLYADDIYTQVSSGTDYMKNIKECTIFSVIISDDKLEEKHEVRSSERKARYDGFIKCNLSYVFIIENKPSKDNIWLEQLNPNVEDAEGNKIYSEPCCMSWRDIIDILSKVMDNNCSAEIEKNLISDFEEYVNEYYPQLNPYDRLGKCNGNLNLLTRRCNSILQSVFENNKEIKYHKGWKYYIDNSDQDDICHQIALDSDGKTVSLWMYAGDIMSRARKLYNAVDVNKVTKLIEEGYTVKPNYHLSYQQTGLFWFNSSVDAIKYIQYWKEHKENILQIKHEKVKSFCEKLSNDNIVDIDDETKNYLEQNLINKNYPVFNTIPGCLFKYEWNLKEAIQLDDQNQLVNECKKKIKRIQETYLNV